MLNTQKHRKSDHSKSPYTHYPGKLSGFCKQPSSTFSVILTLVLQLTMTHFLGIINEIDILDRNDTPLLERAKCKNCNRNKVEVN